MDEASEDWSLLVAVRSTTLGQGVFALQRFEPEEVVGVVTGQVIADPDYEGTTYSIDLGDTQTLEPAAPFRFLNHRCEPNCQLQVVEYEDGSPTEVIVEALCPIQPGEELFIDYGWPADCAIECRCDSEQCRGWIVAKEELAELLERSISS